MAKMEICLTFEIVVQLESSLWFIHLRSVLLVIN